MSLSFVEMADSKWKYNVELYQQRPVLNDRGKPNHLRQSTINEAEQYISMYYLVNVSCESDERRFCSMESESLIHLFWYCHIISIFRMQVQKMCSEMSLCLVLIGGGGCYRKDDFYH